MSVELQAICYAVAFVAFVVGAVLAIKEGRALAIGLAAWVLVPLWAALENL